MNSILSSVFFFVVAIAVLVSIHEFGHFWVARRLGVKVLRFSIGFGKPLWITKRGPDETEYVVAAIPLGGYVRMLDEREGPVREEELHRAFNRQTVAKRSAIVVAGPLFNFLLAVIAYWVIFVIGVPGIKPIVGAVAQGSIAEQSGVKLGDVVVAVDGEQAESWRAVMLLMLEKSLTQDSIELRVRDASASERTYKLDLSSVKEEIQKGDALHTLGIDPALPHMPAVIGTLEPGQAAEQAGLKVGDSIVKVDGKPVAGWEAWVDYVRAHPEQDMFVEIERAGERLPLTIRPRKEGDIGRIGAGVRLLQQVPEEFRSELRYPPARALLEALEKTWDTSLFTARMLGGMVLGQVSISNISGPISIARYASDSASAGLISFLSFLAIISISLGVLNLMPIPLLDGGHLLYYLVEAVKGSPLSEAAQLMGQRIGVALLVLLMMVAFYNDVLHLFK